MIRNREYWSNKTSKLITYGTVNRPQLWMWMCLVVCQYNSCDEPAIDNSSSVFLCLLPVACWDGLNDRQPQTEYADTEKWVHELIHSFSWMNHLFQFEKLEGIPELGVIMEQTEGESERDDRLCLPQTPGDVPDTGPIFPLPSPERHLQHQRQVLAHLKLHWPN